MNVSVKNFRFCLLQRFYQFVRSLGFYVGKMYDKYKKFKIRFY